MGYVNNLIAQRGTSGSMWPGPDTRGLCGVWSLGLGYRVHIRFFGNLGFNEEFKGFRNLGIEGFEVYEFRLGILVGFRVEVVGVQALVT